MSGKKVPSRLEEEDPRHDGENGQEETDEYFGPNFM